MGPLEELRSVAYALARFTGFSANAFLFGLVPVALLVLRPAFAGLPAEEWSKGRRRIGARLEGLVQASLIASATATAIALLLQAVLVAQLNDKPLNFDSFSSSLSTTFGEWYLLRFPLLVGLAVLIVGKVRRSVLAGAGDEGRSPGTAWWLAWAAFGGALLATNTFSGHAAVAEPRAVAIVNDLVHLGSGAIWFAGIIVLAIALPDGWAGQKASARPLLLAPAVTRFSKVALVTIAVVAVTGTINSFLDVNALGDFVHTGYGRTLALKILLFLGILALGGINHFFLRRRLERAEAGDDPSAGAGAQRMFRRTIAAELAVAIGLMGLTGMLVGQARTKQNIEIRPPGTDLSSTRTP
jgi:copper transport protein